MTLLLTVDQFCELDVLGARQTKPACEMWVRLATVWDGAKTRLGQADLGPRNSQIFHMFGKFRCQILNTNPLRPNATLGLNRNDCESVTQSSIRQQLASWRAARLGQGRVCQPWALEFGTGAWRKFGCQCIVRKSAFWHFNCVQMLNRCVKNFSNSPI